MFFGAGRGKGESVCYVCVRVSLLQKIVFKSKPVHVLSKSASSIKDAVIFFSTVKVKTKKICNRQ